MEKKLDLILSELQNMSSRIGNIENELRDFRTETKISLQVIQTGQQGSREEMAQRFKETKKHLEHLESDIELTYQKTALHDLKFNRIENVNN